MTDNLTLWNRLGKTDPAHTKGFKRGGGFSGTAIKPIYTEQKMTETFGPCGIGWGFSEPRFELVPASEGQTAVYCWLALWYVHDGKRSEPIPGVGGDFVVVKQSSGLRTNDEAFKAAFTDAIGNAMKHLGMSADVHMGRYDDSKYVRELENEARQEPPGNSAGRGAGAVSPSAVSAPTSPIHATSAETYVTAALPFIRACNSADDVNEWWSGEKAARVKYGIAKNTKHYEALWTACNERVFELEQKDAA